MPAQKRRRIMESPDGFTKSKAVGTPKPNVAVPPFVSAFEGQEQAVHKTSSKPASAAKVEKVISRPRYDLPLATEQPAPNIPVSSSKPLSVSKPTPALKPVSVSKPFPNTVSLSKPVSKANLRHLEVPTGKFVNSEKSALELRPLKLPIPLTDTSTMPSWQPLPRPPPMRPPEPPTKPNHTPKSLGLPPLPSKPLRTIFTTHIALVNDLSTESGKAELASILLHDQHPEILAHTEISEDRDWNLGVSPQKMGRSSKGKGKEPKFVRNGLAARASMLYSQTHTALALWQKEIENTLLSSDFTSRRLKPDLRLRITKIIDVPVGSGSRRSGTSTSSPGLAICCVPSAPSHHKSASHSLAGEKGGKHQLVVFSFPTTAPPRTNTLHARNPEDFSEGREVYLWEPWQEVALPYLASTTEASSSGEGAELLNIVPAPFPSLPSSFPLSPSPLLVKEEDIALADTALLCSRFLIMR